MSHFNRVFQANELLFANPLNSVQSRTTFDRSHTHKTSLDSGLLVPIYFDEVLPGDTHIIQMNYLARMTTPIVPIADNAVLDFTFFFVPTRILWDDWRYFMGESRDFWDSKNPPLPPQVNSDSNASNLPVENDRLWKRYGGYRPSDLAGYLGLPIKNIFMKDVISGSSISALPFYAYAQIWNDWFRDQNYQSPIMIPKHALASSTLHNVLNVRVPSSGNLLEPIIDDYRAILSGFGLMSVSKLPDYFTTCLPAPQRGNTVSLPTGTIRAQNLEVVNRKQYRTRADTLGNNDFQDFRSNIINTLDGRLNHVYQFLRNQTIESNIANQDKYVIGAFSGSTTSTEISNLQAKSAMYYNGTHRYGGAAGYAVRPAGISYHDSTGSVNASQTTTTNGGALLYHDLVAKMPSFSLGSVNINDLRLAFSVQQFLEIDARGGSRYIEILKNHFGVISPDARLQRAEYIGGFRDYLNVQQVLANTATPQGQHVGDLGAYSLTAGSMSESVVYSATEHGYIMGFVTVRVMHTYGQGIDKVWNRRSRYDYYFPVFDNLGEMPVYKKEIAVKNDVTNLTNDEMYDYVTEVFGYNEAWAEYRWAKNKVTGAFNPNSVSSSNKTPYLSAWSFTDNYSQQPTLNSNWIKENKSNIEQTLAVDSAKFGINQFLFDFFFDVKSTRPMSMFSIPGLTRM